MNKVTNYFSGLSGLQLPIPKYQYPPEHQQSSRLTYYATFFNSIEINSSFYKIPMTRTVARWATEVPAHFHFTFKLFKDITHCKHLAFDPVNIQPFVNAIGHIGDRKACILIQFPPSLTSGSMDQVAHLLQMLKHAEGGAPWRIAVEFRNKAWYHQDVYDLLELFNASLVLQDIPKSATPLRDVHPEFIYVRFHGPTGNYRGSYSDAYLAEYAAYVREWLGEGKTVYVYFNNTAGDAFNDLMRFNALVKD